MTSHRSCLPAMLLIALLIHFSALSKASADFVSSFPNHRQGASRKLAQGNTNVNVNIPGVTATKGPGPPSPPPSSQSPPAPPPQAVGQVNTNVQVSPAADGGVRVVVATPPVPGPQTDVSVNVPGFFNGLFQVGR